MGKSWSEIYIGTNHPNYKRIKSFCQECGKEFETYPNIIESGGGKYCSRECYSKVMVRLQKNKSIRTRVKRICQECGKEFTIKPSRSKHGGGKYCSRACLGKSNSKFKLGSNNPHWKGGMIKRICQECNKEFEVCPARNNSSIYCSNKCKIKSQTKLLLGKNNPNWRGGTSFEPYCIKFNKNFKNRVRAFFGYKCVECGKTQEENGISLSVHHVNYNKMACCDGVESIFVALCVHHHIISNFNRGYWEKHYTDIINTQYGGQCYIPK
jgi:DNA-directed RNA polymerase subunit RPC12/RpoP